MKEKNMKKNKKNKGFTLIELMVVLAIIGVLTTIIAVNVFKTLGTAKKKTCEIELKTLRNILLQYHTDKGRYPTQLAELKTEKYIKKTTDPWGNPYIYVPQHDESGEKVINYKIHSKGPDGKSGTKDDMGDKQEQ